MRYSELTLEGRNAVIEAFRAGKTLSGRLDEHNYQRS